MREGVDRHQLDRRHAELLQVGDHGGVREARVGAAQLGRHLRVAHREAAHVQLVHHALVERRARRAVVAPIEQGRDDDRLGQRARAVGRVGLAVRIAVERVREQRLTPVELALERAGVGIDQELGGIAALALARKPRTVDPIAVALAGLDPGQVAVPHRAGSLGQEDARLDVVRVEETELDGVGDVARHREAGAEPVERRPQGEGLPRPDFHVRRAEHVVCHARSALFLPRVRADARSERFLQVPHPIYTGDGAHVPRGTQTSRHGACTPRLSMTRAEGTPGIATIAAGAVVVAALYFAKDFLLPLALAGLFAFMLGPLVRRLEARARAARALGHSDCGRAALGPRADRLVPLERGHEPRREPPGFSREPGREAARSARAAALAGRRAGLDRPAQQGDRPRGRARPGAQGRDRGVADRDRRARSLRDATARRARNGGHRGRARDLHPRAERSSQADLRAVRAARLAHLAARARGGGSARQRLPGTPGHRLRDCRA